MIGSTCDCANSVNSSRETTRNCCRKKTVAVARIVDTFEENKCCWIKWRGGVERISHTLNCDMSMTDDFTTLQLLGCGVISRLSIGEESRYEVFYLNRDYESGVCLEVARTWSG